MASVMARKSSTSWLGAPSGRRAWMWIIAPPSPAIRRASAPYSSGVYGIAGHWSRFASAPDIAQVMTTGSSRAMALTLPALQARRMADGEALRRPHRVLPARAVRDDPAGVEADARHLHEDVLR